MHLILYGIDRTVYALFFYKACQCKHQHRVKFNTTVKWCCFCNGCELNFFRQCNALLLRKSFRFPLNQFGIDTLSSLVHIVGKGNAIIVFGWYCSVHMSMWWFDIAIWELPNSPISFGGFIDFVRFTLYDKGVCSDFKFSKFDILRQKHFCQSLKSTMIFTMTLSAITFS